MSIPFQSYSTVDGLTQASISSIFEDSNGFIWLGSQNSVDRFDGQEFLSFELNKILEAPSIRYVTDIAEDKQGLIWLGTKQGGLWRYDPRQGSFELYLGSETSESGLDSNEILRIQSNSNGSLFVLSGLGGIFKISTRENGKTEFLKINSSIDAKESVYTHFEINEQDHLFAIRRNGQVDLIRPKSNSNENPSQIFDKIDDGNASFVTSSGIYTRNGKLVLGSQNGSIWIHDFDTKSRKIVDLEYDGKSAGRTLDIAEDQEGRIIMATDDGIFIYDETKDELLRVRRNGELGKLCKVIWSLLVDRSNRLWAGSLGCGFYEEMEEPIFNLFRNEADNANSLSGNGIWTFAEDKLGGIWIATVSNGISRFDPATGNFDRYLQETHDQIDSDNLVNLMIDSKDRLWISTFIGVTIIEMKIDQGKVILGEVVKKMNFDSHAWQFYELRNGDVIVGTGLSGAYVCNIESDSQRLLLDYSELPSTAKSSGVQGIHEDELGNIWLGTFGYGLMKYIPSSGEVIRYLDRKEDFPFGTVVTSITEGREKGELWIGGYDGLKYFNWKTEDFKSFQKMNSNIPDETVYAVLRDEYPFYWLTTNKGVSLFSENEERFINFTTLDGLQDMEFNIQAAIRAKNGIVYLGGINGFNTISHKDLELDQTPSGVMFTGLRIMNKEILSLDDTHFDELLPYTDEITIDAKDLFFELTYATASLEGREQYNFQYKLDGLEDLWLDNGSEKTITFTNIDPGDYRLMVRSSIRNAEWGSPSEIKLRVLPAWYKSWWAKIIWMLIALAILWTILQLLLQTEKRELHRNELERKQQELKREKEANVRLRELDKLKSVFLANMSHEIRTPLTSIIGFADYLSESLPEEHVEYAQYILNGGNRLMETINSVLDLAQLEGRAMKLEIANLDLAEMIPSYLSVFNTINTGKNIVPIEFENLSRESVYAKVDQGALQRIIVNLVGNARKFTTEGSIKVVLEKSEADATIKIIDTGIGIDEEYLPNIFNVFSQESAGANRTHEGNGLGLTITKQLVEMMDGEISVASQKGYGSTFTVSLPLTHPETIMTADET